MRMPYALAVSLRIAVAVYIVFLLYLALGQRRLIYYPVRGSEDEFLPLAEEYGLQPWRNAAGELIGWRKGPEVDGLDVPRVLVFHGNAGCALDRHYFAEGFYALAPPWETFLFEYPGYGARPGRPDRAAITSAAKAAVAGLLKDNQPLYLVGESLGSAVAAETAAAFPDQIRGLWLITPFTSLADVARRHYPFFPVRWLLRERYDAREALRHYRGPVAFLAAEQDEVVGYALSRALFDGYTGPKKIWVQPTGHNALDYTPGVSWWWELRDFLVGATTNAAASENRATAGAAD